MTGSEGRKEGRKEGVSLPQPVFISLATSQAKNPERRVYLGLNQSMSGGFGDSQTTSFILNEGKSSVHEHSTHWNKMATSDFGPVTVTSCETALFLVHIWIISWDAYR